MKKIVCLITALMLCISLASFAFADFVPSISYKGAPTVVEITDDQGNPVTGTINGATGEIIGYVDGDCLLITPLAEANTSTKIPAEARDELLAVYEQLEKGTMKLPYDKDVDADKMVIKDMFDISWLCEDHPAIVAQEGVTVTLTFDIGVAANTDVVVMTYINNTWEKIVAVKNNGDGTITCVFEDFCPVVISIPSPGSDNPDKTGDESNITLWVILLAVSAAGVVALVILHRRDSMK